MNKFNVGDYVRIYETYYRTYNELKDDVRACGEVTRDDIDGLIVVNFNGKKMCCSPAHLIKLDVFTPQQDITEIDVPFGELNRETQLRVIHHMLNGGEVQCEIDGEWRTSKYINSSVSLRDDSKYRAVAKQPVEQDLTTLDVPFGELDRDTQLRLVNHVLDGGEIEFVQGDKRYGIAKHQDDALCFCNDRKYRAVAKQPEQPTERETLEAKLHEQWTELNATMKRITEIK